MKYGPIGLALVVLLGAGAYLMFGREAVAPVAESPSAAEGEPGKLAPQSGTGSWASLLAQGQDVTCDFTATDADTSTRTEGRVYVAGPRVRGDFIMTQEGQPVSMSLIRDAEYTYTWGSTPAGEMALKFKTTEETSPENAAAQDPFKSDAEVTYTCSPWSVEEERLTPPADKEFRDMSSTVNAGAGAQAGASAQCAACDAAPAEARAQCRAALGC